MKTTLHPQAVPRLVQRPTRASSTRAARSETPEMVGVPKASFRSRRVAVRRWAAEFSWRVAINRYVFFGALILVASLIAGAVTRGDEVLWRSAAALGIATVLIGLVHAWLDARSARRSRCSHSKDRVSKECSRGG